MDHRIDSTTAVRYSALFPEFERDDRHDRARAVERGQRRRPVLLNCKCADFVVTSMAGIRAACDAAEIDRQVARVLSALEAKVGKDYLLAVTADHGMPSMPPSPDHRHFAPSIVDLLHEKFDPEGKQLVTSYESENCQIYIDEDRLAKLGLTLRDLAQFLESQPYMFAVFTNDEVA
jgi:hypothetical protein